MREQDPQDVAQARVRLRDLLLVSLTTSPDIARLQEWMHLLAVTGKTDVLADLATQEVFHEVGDPSELRSVLEIAATSPDLPAADRFAILDALTFWDLQYKAIGPDRDAVIAAVSARFSEMQELLALISPNNREKIVICLRRMVLVGMMGDAAALKATVQEGLEAADGDASIERVIHYTYASELYRLGMTDAAQEAAVALVDEYLFHLGLDFDDVFAANPADILALVADDADHSDDFKRLADCLFLYAMARAEGDITTVLARMHAMKFYVLGSAWRSATRVGQEVVDDLLAIGDIAGARSVMEDHLMRVIIAYPMPDLIVAVRSQRAVLFAWSGEIGEARAEMDRLDVYGVAPRQREELINQRALIEQIALLPDSD